MNEYFKELIWDQVSTDVVTRIFGTATSANPIILVIISYIFKITEITFDVMSKYIDMKTIRLKNTDLQKAYERSSIELYVASSEIGKETDEYQKLLENNKKAIRDIARWNI